MSCEHHLHESHQPNRRGTSCSIFLFCCFCLCVLFSYQVQLACCTTLHGGGNVPASVVHNEDTHDHEHEEGEHDDHEIFHKFTSFPSGQVDKDWVFLPLISFPSSYLSIFLFFQLFLI